LAPRLLGISAVAKPISVSVANGQVIQCQSEINQAHWKIQGVEFISNLKLLPLPYYDMILGVDWLQAYSPMRIDWLNKWMVINFHGSNIQLQGFQPSLPAFPLIELLLISDMQSDGADTQLPVPIQTLLQSFEELFVEPSDLPPSRACNHTILLVAGAQPINVRPYRFSHAMKNEIEAQIQDMLSKGIIQHSDSAFSSPVLLVKKKDMTWRFCVDYRHLNALIIKYKYLVPIIDELLDELHGAAWFSSLDLRAGFHQIRLQHGEEYKTAFQTHLGDFEFRVMAFSLTGAPGTFQKAMNTTLAPLLRKCVLVFFDDILVYSTSFEDHLQHLQLVLELLQADQWKVKLSKCSFAQNKISYLGHIISQQGVTTVPDKISAVAACPSQGI
jgi:hypothetical protein